MPARREDAQRRDDRRGDAALEQSAAGGGDRRRVARRRRAPVLGLQEIPVAAPRPIEGMSRAAARRGLGARERQPAAAHGAEEIDRAPRGDPTVAL
jgi:hypothetical protein